MDEVLLGAAEYIDRHGWTRKNEFVFGRACLMGAVKASRKTLDLPVEVEVLKIEKLGYFLIDKMDLHGFHPIPAIINVNDNKLNNGVEASKLLREAAEWDGRHGD